MVPTKICNLRFLVLCLSIPTLLYAQQARTPPIGTPVLSAATAATQPVLAAPRTPAEFFARARQLSDLEAAGIPFHLTATFVATGDTEFTGTGTFEEWWESKQVWRREATLGDYRWVRFRNNGKPVLYTTSAYIPLRLRQTVNALPMAFPSEKEAESDWKVLHKKVSGVILTILAGPYIVTGPGHPTSILWAWAFTPEGALRIQQTGSISTFYNDFQPFQNLTIPRKIGITDPRNRLVAITIDTLEPLKESKGTIAAVPPLPRNPDVMKPNDVSTAGLKASKLINHPRVGYPEQARQQRIQGTVVIQATIDENGRVREPYVLSSAGQLLDDAALDAVRKYRYEPTTLNGTPVCVNTTITFNFTLR